MSRLATPAVSVRQTSFALSLQSSQAKRARLENPAAFAVAALTVAKEEEAVATAVTESPLSHLQGASMYTSLVQRLKSKHIFEGRHKGGVEGGGCNEARRDSSERQCEAE